MRYRIKWTLEDERKVYITFQGKIDARDLEELSLLDFDLALKESAYAENLSTFSQVRFFQKLNIPFVRCKSYELEEETKPIDRTAFIIGGKPACELRNSR